MKTLSVLAIVTLVLALAVLATTGTVAFQPRAALAQTTTTEHTATLDAPHPPGMTETPYGCAATVAELPTGSPGLLEGDVGETAGPGTAGAGIAADQGFDPSLCPGAPEPHA